jgi:hypothetical protein
MEKIMLRRFAGVALILALAAVAATAQTQPPPPKPQEQPNPRPPLPDPAGQPTNIRLELSISDQAGPGESVKKTVTMLIADRGNGSIRSGGSIRGQGRVQINVDASPIILSNGAIRLRLALEYNPRSAQSDTATEAPSLHEQMMVILDAGKPLVLSQSADPGSDRRITVEVRATVLK